MKRLLFFPGHRILAYEWDGSGFRRIEAFEPDDAGRAAFRRWLDEAPRTPVQMLIDVIEEEFHLDHVPHVFARERAHLYQRTVRRHFRASEFTYITRQGRSREGRRDDRVLIAGLTNPDLLHTWLAVLAEARVPLKGIHSLPLVGEYLLPYLGAERSERVLVVSQQVPSTLRQSYYERGRLRFSRLVPGRYEGMDEYADFVHEELHRTLHFLENQRFRGQGKPVDTYVLADTGAHEALRRRLAGSGAMNCHLVALDALAGRLGDRGPATGPYADTIFGQLLLRRRRPANHYGLARLRRFFFVERARVGLRVLAGAAVLAALAVAGAAWLQGRVYERAVVEAEARETRFERLYEQRLSQLDEFAYRAVDVKNAVDLMATVADEARRTPETAMDALGGVLADHPGLTLERLQWSRSPAAAGAAERGSTRAQRAGEGATPVVQLAGHVTGVGDSYREAINRFEAFVAELRAAGFTGVRVERAPFDLEPSTGVSGDSGTTAGEGADERADFALRLRPGGAGGDDG